MVSGRRSSAYDRVAERRRAAALAHHCSEPEGLSIAQLADRLGRSPSTVKAYSYDPAGEKARAVKARYVGVCRGCGPTPGRGTARVTRTRIARSAIRVRFGERGRAIDCWPRWVSATATGGCRRV
jgi:hypothetical protein